MPNLQELVLPLSIDLKKFKEGADEAKGLGNDLATGLSKVGGTVVLGALGAAAAGITAIGVAAVGSIGAANDWADTVDSIGDALGTTAEEGSGLAVLMQGIGGDTEQLTKQLVFMGKSLVTDKGELGATGKAIAGLGISVKDANGNLKSSTQIFQEVADKLSVMPDGLEKTNLMMEIFGKSGSEMSDTLNAAANGGMQAAIEKSKALGLSLGEDAVNGSIQFGKAMNDAKMVGQGLMVTIGNELIPIFTPLIEKFTEIAIKVMPTVRKAITEVGKQVETFVGQVVQFIPVAIQWFQNISNFLSEHKGIIIGILVALGVAVGVFVYTTVIPAAIAMIAALAPIVLPILAIAAAVALLYEAWTNDWGGIRTFLTNVWNNNLKPIFDILVEWLKTNIPKAIEALAKFWTETLKPALDTIWKFISEKLIPIFKAIVDYVRGDLGTKLLWLKTNVIDPVARGFQGIVSAIDGVITKIQGFIEWIKKAAAAIPSIFIPGSPTPFEMGLRGIGNAMEDIGKKQFPKIMANLNMNTGINPVNRPSPTITNNYILNATSTRIDRVEEGFGLIKARSGI